MTASHLVWPLGEGPDGVPWSLYVGPRGYQDVPVLATPSCKVQADLAALLPFLPLEIVSKWADILETALRAERVFMVSTDAHHERVRRCALQALSMLNVRLGMTADTCLEVPR